MPLDSGDTIEHQLIGKDSVGGLQLDVFEGYESNVSFYVGSCKNRNKKELACGPTASFCKSPSQLGLPVGEKIVMKSKYKIQRPTFLKLTAKTIRFKLAEDALGSELRNAIQDREGLLPEEQSLVINGRQVRNEDTLRNCGISDGSEVFLVLRLRGSGVVRQIRAMGIGAGGKIEQKIYKDPLGGPNGKVWKREPCARIHVHMLNSTEFEKVSGILPPQTPISEREYDARGIPWFQLYDENVAGIMTAANSPLDTISSVGLLD
ncbi:hypothetical protein HK102_006978 [Quaeritorhiza haematococci]|nr:hypothetical protein HK102_006978 [Quaeritorhiza haematococci]